MNENLDLKKFIDKVNDMKKEEKLDLSSDQDLSIAIMNLVSLEEHFFFTGARTDNPNYYDLLQEVRLIRQQLLKKIVKNSEGEIWCISKHLLAASMRLMEVGTKQHGKGQKEEAEDLFKKAFEIYSLFWAVNFGVINTKDVTKIDDNAISKEDKKPEGFLRKVGELVKKAVNCCIE